MKYSVSIDINKPLAEVVKLFDNPDYYSEWMEGLINYDVLKGNQGEVGTKARIDFKMEKRDVTMTETVLENNLPEKYTVSYEATGVYNVVSNSFKIKSDQVTTYTTAQEFKFKGFMKLIALFMPGAFKKQSMKYLNAFKAFVEKA